MTGSAPKRFPLGLGDLVRAPRAKGDRAGGQSQAGEKANIGAKTATKATVAHAGFNSKPAKTAKSGKVAAAKKSASGDAAPRQSTAGQASTGQTRPAATGHPAAAQTAKHAAAKVPPESRQRAAVLATEHAKPHERARAEREMPGFVVRSPMRVEPPVKIVRSVATSVKQAVGMVARARPPVPVTSFVTSSAAQKGGVSKTVVPFGTVSRNQPVPAAGSTPFTLTSERVRERMVERVRASGASDPRVLAAMAAVPRHLFVDPGLATQAYEDAALPIGHHQTISKPSVVARMIELVAVGRELGSVLEIGTGCGYQAAVLAGIARDVYSIERIRPLHERAKQNLRPLRIRNIRLHYGDGRLGIPSVAPFDAIVIAAAGLDVPQALLEQLQIGGRLIAPVGGESQRLTLIERVAANEWHESQLDRVFFVPLKSGVI